MTIAISEVVDIKVKLDPITGPIPLTDQSKEYLTETGELDTLRDAGIIVERDGQLCWIEDFDEIMQDRWKRIELGFAATTDKLARATRATAEVANEFGRVLGGFEFDLRWMLKRAPRKKRPRRIQKKIDKRGGWLRHWHHQLALDLQRESG